LKITFLGTGTSQGVPVIACKCSVCHSDDIRDNRLRTSVLIEVDEINIVIDAGPDFRQQMLREGIERLDAIIFTHEHKDHIGGLDEVRAFNFVQQKEMDVYATSKVQEALKSEFKYAFEEELKYPGIPEVKLHTIDDQPFQISGVTITPIKVMHYKLEVLGFRIKDFTYITDANYISPESMKLIHGSKLVVLNALRKEPHISHFTLDEAIDILRELDPERGCLTHISHQMGKYVEITPNLPKNIELAYDGLDFSV